jgi:hypothetical protein
MRQSKLLIAVTGLNRGRAKLISLFELRTEVATLTTQEVVEHESSS